MRFYEEWQGFIWEYNSIGEYVKAVIGRLLGTIIVIGLIVFLISLI
jgi:hypothetical protein